MFKKFKNIILFILRLRTSKRHVYILGKTLWYQEELTYEEDGRIRMLLKEIFGTAATPEKFGESIDMLYEKGAVPQLLDVVLKRYEPTVLHRVWNNFWMPKRAIYLTMKNSEIASVLSDFFFFNTRWIGDLMSLLSGLGLRNQTISTASTRQASRN